MNKIETWKPSASIENLLKRTLIISEIRRFFSERDILEVETPYLSHSATTDIHLSPFKTHFFSPGLPKNGVDLYLSTSPEYHMKRLLAAGFGPIFQLCRSFRNEEVGKHHNPEFTLLEWYRPYYDMFQLMNETNDFLQQILQCPKAEKLSYQKAFQLYLEIDPLSTNKTELYKVAEKLGLKDIANTENDQDVLLQLIFTICIEPKIGKNRPIFIYHFPVNQASLAKINSKDHRVAERFEVYYKGIELANGFCELTDACEQERRFKKDNQKRAIYGLPQQSIDFNLIEALRSGIPESSGIAFGVDRLVMLALGANHLSEVISFSIERA